MATKKIYYVADGEQEEHAEVGSLAYADGYLPDAGEAEASEPRCSICNELLAWHEQACSTLPASPAVVEAAPDAKTKAQPYAYGLGHIVQPLRQPQARTIIWRGQLKARHSQTGLVHRVNVYLLNDNFWDCYYEEELQAAA